MLELFYFPVKTKKGVGNEKESKVFADPIDTASLIYITFLVVPRLRLKFVSSKH